MAKKSFCVQADLMYEEQSNFLDDISYHAANNPLVNLDFDSWVKEWQITPEELQYQFPEFFNNTKANPKELTEDEK